MKVLIKTTSDTQQIIKNFLKYHIMAFTLWIYTIFIACIGLIILCIYPSMDAFSSYHVLACNYFPNAILNSFHEPCDGTLDLILPWNTRIPRNYAYIGSFPSWYYYPFYLLYPHPLSAYISGLVLLLITILGAQNLLKCSFKILIPTIFTNFYILYNFIQDQGVAGIQIALVFWIPLLVRKAVQCKNKWRILSITIAAAILAFIGIESKPLFANSLPGICLIILAISYQHVTPIKKNGRKLLYFIPSLMLFLLLTFSLFFSKNIYGEYYIHQLIGISDPIHFFSDEYFTRLKYMLITYWSQFGSAANYSYHYNRTPPELFHLPVTYYDHAFSYLFWLAAAIIFTYYFLNIRVIFAAEKAKAILNLSLIISGIAVLLLVITTRSLVNPHHLAVSLVIICASLAMCTQWLWSRNPALARCLLLIISTSQLGIAAYLSLIEPEKRASKTIFDVLAILDNKKIAKESLIICANWGTYYIYSLYGSKEQAVIFVSPFLLENIGAINEIATKTHRTPVIISGPESTSRLKKFSEIFPGTTKVYPLEDVPSDITIWSNTEFWVR